MFIVIVGGLAVIACIAAIIGLAILFFKLLKEIALKEFASLIYIAIAFIFVSVFLTTGLSRSWNWTADNYVKSIYMSKFENELASYKALYEKNCINEGSKKKGVFEYRVTPGTLFLLHRHNGFEGFIPDARFLRLFRSKISDSPSNTGTIIIRAPRRENAGTYGATHACVRENAHIYILDMKTASCGYNMVAATGECPGSSDDDVIIKVNKKEYLEFLK